MEFSLWQYWEKAKKTLPKGERRGHEETTTNNLVNIRNGVKFSEGKRKGEENGARSFPIQ